MALVPSSNQYTKSIRELATSATKLRNLKQPLQLSLKGRGPRSQVMCL